MKENMIKYIENLAVNKFFDKSNGEIVRNDVIDYIKSLKLKASSYEKMRACINACERLNDFIDLEYYGYKNFREAARDLFS